MAKNGELTEIQSRALKMLLEGATAGEVAKALGKGKRTIDRWRASQPFKDALSRVNEQVEQKVVFESSDRIANIKNLALDAIEKILQDDEESPRIKVNAAKIAGKWCGLELPESQIEFQLDKLQQKMPPEAYHALILALAEDSPASARNPRFN